jgi:predicted dehydrogenase
MMDIESRDVEGFDVDDYTTAIVKMKNGIIASVKTGCYIVDGSYVPNGMNIYCEDATVHYDLRKTVFLKDKNGEVTYNRACDQNALIDRGFIDAVKTGDRSTIRSSYADAIKTLRLCMACQESADSGKVIYLD